MIVGQRDYSDEAQITVDISHKYAKMYRMVSKPKAMKASVEIYFLSDRRNHRLRVPFRSDKSSNFPPELRG